MGRSHRHSLLKAGVLGSGRDEKHPGKDSVLYNTSGTSSLSQDVGGLEMVLVPEVSMHFT